MKPILVHPSWHDVEKGTALIIQSMLQLNDIPVSWVVGLTRGGLVPAVIASQMLNIPMMPVNYSSKEGNGDNKNHNNYLPDIRGDIASGHGIGVDAPTLLIIDDIADTGHTLKDVSEHYIKKGHKVFTGSLYFRETSCHVPHFFVHLIGEDDPWIIFPWEC